MLILFYYFQKGDDSEGNQKKKIIFDSRERIDCISSEKHIVKKRYILDRLKDRFLFQNLFLFIIFLIIKIFVCVGSRLKGIGSITGWNRRARGFCSRILNALCPCFTSNGKS